MTPSRFRTQQNELAALKKSPGFISAYKDRTVEAHTIYTSDFLKLNPSSGLWPASGTQFNTSMCNRKLIGANYFNKGILANDPTVNISMNSAKDTNSHGTHCGSIAAGNFVKDLIAAIDQIVADGVDIISISFGNHFITLYEDAISIASFGAMIKGVLVSASAGNRGPSWGTLGNRSPWILCVASGYTDRTFAGTLTLGNWFKIKGWSLFPARAFFRDSSMIYNKTVATYKSDELLVQVPDLEGTNIIYDYNPDEDGFGYLVNFLTSYAGIAKPDIRDPGVHILAAVPPNLPSSTVEPNIQLTTDYELKTGTSMVASHATGITAMVKGVHPEWSPLAIRSAMMTTTNHLDSTQKPIREDGNMIAMPLSIMLGHIDPNRALDPGLVYDATPQDYVNLICSLNSQKSNSKYLQDLQPTTTTTQIHLLISITHHSLPFIHSTRRETTPGWSRNSGEHLQILVKVEQLIELK
ncbi:putative subtilisin-like protease-like [Capsicum annuum]|nr:putative subtilisin-like protease-like [Capsicum annuum]